MLGAHLPILTDLRQVILSAQPLMDVRAPIEFNEGAIPQAQNLPLMSDAERAAVGTCYKRRGQQAAIELGHELVSGAVKAQRVQAWAEFIKTHPTGALYCFRGGLRSRITQQWIHEATGIAYPRIQGGYKALRRFLLDTLNTLPQAMPFLVLSGRTGTGKTRVLRTLSNTLDLEGIAHHRGSAFGQWVQPQPSQISFENGLASRLLHLQAANAPLVLVEDECRTIGSLHVPNPLFDKVTQAPIVVVERPDDERIELTFNEYVVEQLGAFQAETADSDAAFKAFEQYLLTSVKKIERRLGGVRYSQVLSLMQQALEQQQQTGDLSGHEGWVRFLLKDYYDPMYDYQLSRKQQRVLMSGSLAEVREYLTFRSQHPV